MIHILFKVHQRSEKIKDPKKVEAGKRLAAISREARERTVVEPETAKTEGCHNSIEYKYNIGGVGVVAAVGGLYFAYKCDRREVNAANS